MHCHSPERRYRHPSSLGLSALVAGSFSPLEKQLPGNGKCKTYTSDRKRERAEQDVKQIAAKLFPDGKYCFRADRIPIRSGKKIDAWIDYLHLEDRGAAPTTKLVTAVCRRWRKGYRFSLCGG